MNNINQLLSLPAEQQASLLNAANALLNDQSAEQRIQWCITHLPQQLVMSSSFGIQAAVMLHLMVKHTPSIPVILLDTGYLFPETYQFIDQLTTQLSLNLKVYRALHSANWQEARYGKLWEKNLDGITRYNQINKVEPLNRALSELNAQTWFSGLRREQAQSRADKPILEISRGVIKVYPIIDWTKKDVYYYLKEHKLPYHPLWEQGYISIGDTHSTQPLSPGMNEEDTRFNGITRECGIHLGEGI